MPTNEPPEPEPSGRTGLGHQIRKRPFITLGLATVASLIIGWAVGTWTTCGPRCGFDADLFGAWGAWVGGLATTGAFAFTAHELVSSRRREEKVDQLRAEEILTEARKVHLNMHVQIGRGKESLLLVSIYNCSRSPITRIEGITVNGEQIFVGDQVDNDKSKPKSFTLPLAGFPGVSIEGKIKEIILRQEVPGSRGDIVRLKTSLEETLRNRTVLFFTLEGERFCGHPPMVFLM